jgi:predicted Holliday junction resolvase-like endonuclease
MIVVCVVVILLLDILAMSVYRKLYLLRSISQIQAEVELEMHSRAHKLLVQRDQLEVGLVKDAADEADEKWKGDLAEYMEEFEQEALLRSKKRLNRV